MKGKLRAWFAFSIIATIAQPAIHLIWAQSIPAEGNAQPGKANSLRIAIWVYNYPPVPNRTLAEAEKEVERIFATAGISAEWIQCPVSAAEVQANPACQERMSATELGLTILPQFKASKNYNTDTQFGSAQVFTNGQFGHYAYVYYDQVENPAYRGMASVGQILAEVAAHELGHLLLRSVAHGTSGLMRARLDWDDLRQVAMGQLLFSPKEAERIRAEVRARIEASTRTRGNALPNPQSSR